MAQNRGQGIEADLKAGGFSGTYDPSKHHLLLIAIDDYKYWPDLSCPVADAKAFGKIMVEQYGVPEDNVEELFNGDATKDGICETLTKYRKLDPSCSLLIYYAGHGHLDEETEIGYWIPQEASENAQWDYVSTTELVKQYIASLKVRHLLVIADSCFAGALLRTRSGGVLSKFEAENYRHSSRYVLTSGGDEPVPDSGGGGHSVFNLKLQQFLRGELGDGKQVFTPDLIYQTVGSEVTDFTGQNPKYARLNDPKDTGGRFVFVRYGELPAWPLTVAEKPRRVVEAPVIAPPAPRYDDETPMVPPNSLAVLVREPEHGVLYLDGREYDVNSGPIVYVRQGRTPFRIRLPQKMTVYGVFEVPEVGESTQDAVLGGEPGKEIFKASHVEAALQGRPVRYEVAVQSRRGGLESAVCYRLSLRPIN